MVTIEELDRLVALMQETGMASLFYEDGRESVRLELAGAADGEFAAADTSRAEAPAEPVVVLVTSQGLGEFLDRHPTEDQPLVKPGARVSAAQVVGYLRVGPTLTPVVTEASGIVRRTLIEHGTRIGFGTPVLELVEGQ